MAIQTRISQFPMRTACRLVATLALFVVAAAMAGSGAARAQSDGGGAMNIARAPDWSAAAPGVVEPRSGEIELAGTAAALVAAVLVEAGDTVRAGQPLILLADEETLARVRAAEADVEIAERARDAAGVRNSEEARQDAEDALASAQKALFKARERLDETASAASGAVLEAAIDAVRERRTALNEARAALENVLRDEDGDPMREAQAGLVKARSQRALAYEAHENRRIRAPADGSVLKVGIAEGELVAPSPQQVVLVLGNLSQLRVRAEVDEKDAGKIEIGQEVIVRAAAFPDTEFEGVVGRVAPRLGPAEIGTRGPARALNANVLEVMVDVTSPSPLIPGMQVDVLFKPADSGDDTDVTGDAAAADTGDDAATQ